MRQDFFDHRLCLLLNANFIFFLLALICVNQFSIFILIVLLTGVFFTKWTLMIPGLMIGFGLHCYTNWICQHEAFLLKCHDHCTLHGVISEGIERSVLPIKIYGLNTQHCDILVNGSLERINKNGLLPLVRFSLIKFSIKTLRPHTTLTPWHQSSKKLRSLYDCFLLGRVDHQQPWIKLVGRLGLLHFLCFSGWHVLQLHSFLSKNNWIFIPVSLYLSWLLAFPFPWVRSVAFFLLRLFYSDRFLCWQMSVWLGLICDPLCWTSWGFWMTCYYTLFLEYKKTSAFTLRLAGLAWSGLLQGKVDLVLFFIGGYLEKPITLGLISFCIMSVGLECWMPNIFKDIFDTIDNFSSVLIQHDFIAVELKANFCFFILSMLFYSVPSKKIQLTSFF